MGLYSDCITAHIRSLSPLRPNISFFACIKHASFNVLSTYNIWWSRRYPSLCTSLQLQGKDSDNCNHFIMQLLTFGIGNEPVTTAAFISEESVLCGCADGDLVKFDLRKTRFG